MRKISIALLVVFEMSLMAVEGNSFARSDDFRYTDISRDYSRPGAHQLASWIVSQLRLKEPPTQQDIPILPYRLSIPGKRNSEVSNAIIGSEETQKMYRDGRSK